MSDDRLKRCPFCGGTAAILEVEETDNRGGFVVQCRDCECSTRVWFPIKDDVRQILADAWNRRVAPAAAGAAARPSNALIQSELDGAIDLLHSMNFGVMSRPYEALQRIMNARQLLAADGGAVADGTT